MAANMAAFVLWQGTPFRSQISDMNQWISFLLGTVMTYDRILMHVILLFGPVQYGRQYGRFFLWQVTPFRSQISEMNEWILFILGTVMTYDRTLMHVILLFGPVQNGCQ